MTALRSCKGKVYLSTTQSTFPADVQLLELNNWNFTETANRSDVSRMGDCSKSYQAGAVETTGNIAFWWQHEGVDTGQDRTLLDVGAQLAMTVYPEGEPGAAPDAKDRYDADIIVTSLSLDPGGVDGNLTGSFDFTVDGPLQRSSEDGV